MKDSLRSLVIKWQGDRSEVAAARSINLSPNTLGGWKDGRTLPSRLAIPALAAALGIPQADLEALVAAERAARRSTAATTA